MATLEDVREERLAILKAERRIKEAQATKEEKTLAEFLKVYDFNVNGNMHSRTLPLVGVIHEDMVEHSIDVLNRWGRISNDPITVRLTSPGGEVTAGITLYESLRSIADDGIRVRVVVLGQAASMAAVLLQAGDERIIGPYSTFMFHQASLRMPSEFMELGRAAENVESVTEQQNVLAEILAEKSVLTKNEILRKIKKGDWTLKADQAVKFGLADRIGRK